MSCVRCQGRVLDGIGIRGVQWHVDDVPLGQNDQEVLKCVGRTTQPVLEGQRKIANLLCLVVRLVLRELWQSPHNLEHSILEGSTLLFLLLDEITDRALALNQIGRGNPPSSLRRMTSCRDGSRDGSTSAASNRSRTGSTASASAQGLPKRISQKLLASAQSCLNCSQSTGPFGLMTQLHSAQLAGHIQDVVVT